LKAQQRVGKPHRWIGIARRVVAILSLAAYKLIRAGLLLIAVASVGAYFGEWLMVFDFASQLRLQYVVGAIVGLAFTIGKREWRWSAIAVLGIALNIWPIVSWYVPNGQAISQGRRLKLVQYNLLYPNDRHQNLIDFLREEQPDIVALQEMTPEWMAGLTPLSAQFEESRFAPRNDGMGVGIYSRLKFEQAETIALGSDQRPNLLVKFRWEDRPVSLLVTHPPNPFGPNRFAWRNEQLVLTASLLNSLPTPKILIGDLNITMWSPYYQRLMRDTQLVNTRAGQGLLPTWPTDVVAPFLMIPIDHCLISPDIQVAAIRTGRNLGSDHLPLVIELVFPTQK
jgi:endonuclease/exonuclease/phosphatase (EEP) superfamily protein YafD